MKRLLRATLTASLATPGALALRHDGEVILEGPSMVAPPDPDQPWRPGRSARGTADALTWRQIQLTTESASWRRTVAELGGVAALAVDDLEAPEPVRWASRLVSPLPWRPGLHARRLDLLGTQATYRCDLLAPVGLRARLPSPAGSRGEVVLETSQPTRRVRLLLLFSSGLGAENLSRRLTVDEVTVGLRVDGALWTFVVATEPGGPATVCLDADEVALPVSRTGR